MICFQRVPIMKNVRENFYEGNLTYVFYYCGVSINPIWVWKCIPARYPIILPKSVVGLFPRTPYYEKRKGKILPKNFALRF